MQIVWSRDAIKDYHQNIDYLLSNWPESSAIKFIEEVKIILDVLKENPELYPVSNYKLVRRAVVRKQVTLFYKIIDNSIYLVRFWNTYQNPDSLNL